MLYALPKKIQLTPSQAKWSIQSPRSVLILLNLNALEQLSGWAESDLAVHLQRLLKKLRLWKSRYYQSIVTSQKKD